MLFHEEMKINTHADYIKNTHNLFLRVHGNTLVFYSTLFFLREINFLHAYTKAYEVVISGKMFEHLNKCKKYLL